MPGSGKPDTSRLWELSCAQQPHVLSGVYLTLIALWGFGVGVASTNLSKLASKDFYVQIASQCSGVEGIALITMFMGDLRPV